MAKTLNDILKGVRKSKTAPPDIDSKNLYQWNSPDGVKFIKKHEIETHDYPQEDEAAFKGKKGGADKTSKYKFQKDGVYEEAECNKSGKGVHCEMHGDSDCSGSEPKDMPKKGQKVLLDKKKSVEEASQYRSTYGMGKRGWASSKAGKVTFQDLHPLPKGGPSKQSLRDIADKATATGNITKLPAGKAKGLKEDEIINEVAPPNPKIESWIKANKERFVKEYGKEKGMQVLYAKAWKMHGQSESGSATNTDYTGPGAAGWTTGRLDVGTL